MKKLFLDTTIAKKAKVEIYDGEKLISSTLENTPLDAIEKALEKTGLKLKEIEELSANPGPGSYTGIRVGLAVINSLNWALGRKVDPKEPIYQ